MTLRISRMSLITRDCMCEGEREREWSWRTTESKLKNKDGMFTEQQIEQEIWWGKELF